MESYSHWQNNGVSQTLGRRPHRLHLTQDTRRGSCSSERAASPSVSCHLSYSSASGIIMSTCTTETLLTCHTVTLTTSFLHFSSRVQHTDELQDKKQLLTPHTPCSFWPSSTTARTTSVPIPKRAPPWRGCSTSPAPRNRAAGLGGVRGARGLHTHLSRAPHTGRSHRLWAEGRDLHSRRRPSHRPPGCPLGASNSSLCDKDHDSFALSRICHLKTDTTIQKPEPTHSSKHGRQETDPEVPPQVSLKEMLSPCPVTGLIPSRYFWAM